MKEEWKDVIGYEGLYQVSTLGRVYSKKTNLYLVQMSKRGYMAVNLYFNRKMSTRTVHRLVALAFIPNPENKPQVNHIDYDRTNNKLSNLEWVTVQENSDHSYNNYIHHSLAHVKKVNDSGMNKKIVVMNDVYGNFIREYESMSAASIDMCGKVSANICNHINKSERAGKTAYGYIWHYKNK